MGKNHGGMHASTPMEAVVLETRVLHVEVPLSPFSLVIRRAGRSLLRAGGAWAVDGEIRDQILQFTEECLSPRSAGRSSLHRA